MAQGGRRVAVAEPTPGPASPRRSSRPKCVLDPVARLPRPGRDPRQEARNTLGVPRHLVVHAGPYMSHATRTAASGVSVRVCPCQLLPSVAVSSLKCGGRRRAEKSRKADLLPIIGGEGNKVGSRRAAFVHRRRGCLRSLHMPLAQAECYGLMQKGAAVSDVLRRLQNTSSTVGPERADGKGDV